MIKNIFSRGFKSFKENKINKSNKTEIINLCKNINIGELDNFIDQDIIDSAINFASKLPKNIDSCNVTNYNNELQFIWFNCKPIRLVFEDNNTATLEFEDYKKTISLDEESNIDEVYQLIDSLYNY